MSDTKSNGEEQIDDTANNDTNMMKSIGDDTSVLAVKVPQINVDVNTEGNIVANISEIGKTFQKCEHNVESIITLQYDLSGGITSITFTPPSICVKDIPTDLTAANGNSGGYRKVKRSTRKNKKRRSKRKY
jgi:hypothetical protein